MLINELLRIIVGFPLALAATYVTYVLMFFAVTKGKKSQCKLGIITPLVLVNEIILLGIKIYGASAKVKKLVIFDLIFCTDFKEFRQSNSFSNARLTFFSIS